MNSTVELLAADWGRSNWDFATPDIQCRADAVGANVYAFFDSSSGFSVNVLARSVELAWEVVREKFLESLFKKKKKLELHIENKKNALLLLKSTKLKIEKEIDDAEFEIVKLNESIKETKESSKVSKIERSSELAGCLELNYDFAPLSERS